MSNKTGPNAADAFFAPRVFNINKEYLPLLEMTRDWVSTEPVCDHIVFFNDGLFQPQMRNASSFSVDSDFPYAFIRTFPEQILHGMLDLIPSAIREEFRIRPEHARIFCNFTSLDWHSDAPYRTRAINIAVSDSLGDTSSKYTVKSPITDSEHGFTYEYGRGYAVDIANLHRIYTNFLNSRRPRILFSFSIG
jgi:hypothetical protein